jgi:Ulp1 family protease
MILHQKISLPTITGTILKERAICTNPHLYQKMCTDEKEAMRWLRHQLYSCNLVRNTGIDLEYLFVPVNLENRHWILMVFNIPNRKYYTLDPYKSYSPQIHKKDIERLAENIRQEFELGLLKFGQTANFLKDFDLKETLPKQYKTDSINCGVYVCLYMIILSLKLEAQRIFLNKLPKHIDECRALLLAWILKGEIFVPDDQVSSRR